MGNHHKFKLSDMIPNAWLQKLKALSTAKSAQNSIKNPSSSSSGQHPQILQQRKSYYFTRDLTTATTSAKLECSDKKKKNTTVLAGCGCPVTATVESLVSTKLPPPPPENSPADNGMLTSSTTSSSSKTNHEERRKIQLDNKFTSLPEFKLPSIRTNTNYILVKAKEQEDLMMSPRRLSVGLKLRTGSPRITGNKRMAAQSQRRKTRSTRTRKRRSLSESFAVVKSSADPKRDFMESMVEMIVENNIRDSRELEDLLACYLSLNSSKYHDLIIGVFKQLWFEYVAAT